MRVLIGILAGAAAAASAAAQEATRQLEAHEHGHSTLNIAIDGNLVELELISPGADLVGFEHEARGEADKAALAAAEAKLSQPLALFELPAAAGCRVTGASVEIEGEEHAREGEHAEGEDEGEHNEFHATYSLACADGSAVDAIRFGFFDAFPNAEEIEVTVVSPRGQSRYEVERGTPRLDLTGQS